MYTFRYLPLEKRIYSSFQNNYLSSLEKGFIPEYSKISRNIEISYEKYDKKEYESSNFITQHEESIHHTFLLPSYVLKQFIGKTEKIEHYVKRTFRLLMGFEFPKNIIIKICSKEELKSIFEKISNEKWSEGILGFSINNQILNKIYIMENDLALLMLTIGHEIGHVLSPSLPNKKLEEAKAFAFELAWARIIVEHDIAFLSKAIKLFPNPAKNGIHDSAFEFVLEKIKKGKKPMEIYEELVRNGITLADILGFKNYKTIH